MEATLAGRLLAAGCELPKKSSPSKESPGRVGFGEACACGCLGGARIEGSVVLGRTGGATSSSANKSMDACGRCCTGGWVGATFCEAERSIFAFSWTRARGCKSQYRFRCTGKETHDIVVADIQCGRVRHRTVHDPALGFIFRPDKILYLPAFVSIDSALSSMRLLTRRTGHGRVSILIPNT